MAYSPRRVGAAVFFAVLLVSLCSCAKLRAQGASSAAAGPTANPLDPAIPAGSIFLRKYPGGYTAFKLMGAGGTTIVMDPFLLDERVRADVVSISHGHLDHADLSMVEKGCAFAEAPAGMSAKGAVLTGFPGVHNKGDAELTNVMRLIELDGFRLVHFGAQAEIPSQEILDRMGKVDIAIVQVFRMYGQKMTVDEVEILVKSVGARIVIPAHGDASTTPLLAAALGAELRKIPSGRLLVDRAMLSPDSPIIVVDMDTALP
jgi:L-ascorbate metabolism protein UlaG (beta-lactamase superfamily)